MVKISDYSVIQDVWDDIFNCLLTGMRFDLRAATIGFCPLFLTGLTLTTTNYFDRLLLKIIPVYSFVLYFLATLLSIANYHYYKTYSNYFDIFVFGIVEDDTESVLKIIWQDYPVLPPLLFSLFIATIATKSTTYLLKRLIKWQWPVRNKTYLFFLILINTAVYSILARGSLGTFPLREYHVTVSKYEPLNKVVPNAFMSLTWAIKAYKEDIKFEIVNSSQYNYLLQKILKLPEPIYHTPVNTYLEKQQPNVVLCLMESMGTNLLMEDAFPDNDLLGSLRNDFNHAFLFRRFLPSANDTIESIVNIFFQSNVRSLTYGAAKKIPLSNSAFLPYKKAGYKVVYVMGSYPTWRNIREYMLLQGVDEFYDQNDIQTHIPESKLYANTWGVHDAYAFEFTKYILEKNTHPVIIIVQTLTNHPPYKKPSNYTPKPLTVSQRLMEKLELNESKARDVLETYQYAMNALGDFIKDVKNSKKTTIIAATGDHRLRNFTIKFPEDLGHAYSVPFYLYVPDQLLEHIEYHFDPMRIGSHRDIFPTLYNISLSNASYYSLGGRNLLQKDDIVHPIGINKEILITSDGVIHKNNPSFTYPWKNDYDLQISNEPIKNLYTGWIADFNKLNTAFINSQIKGNN